VEDIDDMGEFYRERREANKRHRENTGAAVRAKLDPKVWTKHTDWHYTRIVDGNVLSFWPSTSKFQYRDKVYNGGLPKMTKFFKDKGIEL
jgi:hypothetical protein